MVRALVADREAGIPTAIAAARVHNALAEAIVAVAERAGEPRVVLTGGCFQNRLLTERAVRALERAGFRPCWHQRVPPNDGGLAFGQIAAAAWRLDADRARPGPAFHHATRTSREESPCVSQFPARS